MRIAWALALAAASVLVLVGACSTPSTATQSTPRTTPVSDYGPPPTGVPLLYVHDPKHSSWLSGFDWTGEPRGTIKLHLSVPLRQGPDGSAFETGTAIKGGGQGFLDRLGQTISGPPGVASTVRELWADDSRHMCLVTLDQDTFTWGLSTIQPGESTRPVAVIARDQGIGQSGIDPVACSFKNDFAILVRSTIAWPAEEWVVRLSDGLVLAHRQYVFQQLESVVASLDGAYVAENSVHASPLGSPPPNAAPTTAIRKVADNTVVANLDPKLTVLAFSGDDTRVLVGDLIDPVVGQGGVPQNGLGPSHLQIVDWKTGRVEWRYDGPEALGSFLAQPVAGGIAVGLRAAERLDAAPCGSTSQTLCPGAKDPLRDILIVQGDGSVTHITGQFETTW
ncbi:MAG TPA: hypothetical protein VLU92_03375 [Candidatus Dormibacteraeota bacterium]|nr:hypothetical protein [Candidatus Dormibacteraeota bacterium]